MPVNVADRPPLCDFILPAIVDRDEVVVAVSTGGASPTLATLRRGRIEAALPARLGAVARLAATFRAQAERPIAEPARRRTFFRRLVEGPAGRLALAGDYAGARRAALGELDAARRHMTPQGIAHIAGAGPGDPDLLTLRAAQLLQEADAILHDDLVPPAILARARRDAEMVSVGKRKGRASWAQADINAGWCAGCGRPSRGAAQGRRPVRVRPGRRGGRGFLQAAGVAGRGRAGHHCGAGLRGVAGIPLTHRRLASAVTFVSGHSAPENHETGREAQWPALAAQGHTLAIYMGATEAVSVRDRLLGAGADPNTPVAVVENGTRPDERVSRGRLADLARLAVPHISRGGAGPSLIIVGDVAALAATAEQPFLAEVS